MKEQIVSLIAAVMIANLEACSFDGKDEKKRLEIIEKIKKNPIVSVLAKAIETDVMIRALGGAGQRAYSDLRRALLFTYRNNLKLGARLAVDHGVAIYDALVDCDMHDDAAAMMEKINALLAEVEKQVIHE